MVVKGERFGRLGVGRFGRLGVGEEVGLALVLSCETVSCEWGGSAGKIGYRMALTQRREDGEEGYGSVEHCVRNTGFPLREEGGEFVGCSCRRGFVRLEKEGMCDHLVSLGVHCGACGEASRCSHPRRDGEGVCVECGRRETQEEAGERKAGSKLGRLKARMAKTKVNVKRKVKTKQKKRKGKAD